MVTIGEDLQGTYLRAPERDLKGCVQNLLFSHISDKRLAATAALFFYGDKIVLCRTDRVRIHVIEWALTEPSDMRGAFLVTEEDLKLLNRGLNTIKREAAWVFHLHRALPVWEQQTERDVTRVPLEKSDELSWLQRIGAYRQRAVGRLAFPSSRELGSVLKDKPGMLTIACRKPDEIEIRLTGEESTRLPEPATTQVDEPVMVSMQSRYIAKWLPNDDHEVEVLITGTRTPVRWSWGNYRLWLMPVVEASEHDVQ